MIISKKRWKINYDVGRVERPHKSLDPDSPLERKPLYYQNRQCFLHWFRASATQSLFYNYSQRGAEAHAGVTENRADKRETKPWLQEGRQPAAETHLDNWLKIQF